MPENPEIQRRESHLGVFQQSPKDCHSWFSSGVTSLLSSWMHAGVSSGTTMVIGRPTGEFGATWDRDGQPT